MTNQLDRRAVIVGYDGSAAAQLAVVAAAGEAELRGLPLQILHVVDGAPAALPLAGEQPHPGADAFLDEAAALARPILSSSRLILDAVPGHPARELLDRSAGAELVVLGYGKASALGVLLGSVALEVVNRARCPVIVVRDAREAGPASGGTVVVGVDGITDSEDALTAAFTEAELRHADLVAVHTWHYPTTAGPGDLMPLVYDPVRLEADETAILREAVRPFREKFSSVAVTEQLTEGATIRTLIEVSADARMLVVGTRGRGPVRSLLLGSVGLAVVRRAHCAVLVARSRES